MIEKRTQVSLVIFILLVCLLAGLSIAIPGLWAGTLSHWIVQPAIALLMTLLVGLILMDDLFELDKPVCIRITWSKVIIEIRKYLVWAFVLVCLFSVLMEVVQFVFSRHHMSWKDPLLIIAGSVAGIVLHIIGSKWLMKRVEFELERWEDNVL